MARVGPALRDRFAMDGAESIYDDGRLSLDLVKRLVRADGTCPGLTLLEYDLLRELFRHRGKVLTHRHLLHTAWGGAEAADVQAMRVHIRHLRQKIEADPEALRLITAEPGVGHRFVDAVAA